MIRYALICESGHDFESWFSTSAGFEKLAKRGLLSCPVCGSAQVERAIMSPAIARSDRGQGSVRAQTPVPETDAAATPAPVPPPVALMGEKDIAIRQMLTALHRHVADTAEHVGPRFAQEALSIHHGESEGRPIYGEATPEDARMLQEEGVAFMPLPRLPDAGN